ncbi:hypothetical protein [Armatimonas sp.]|uniref:hypothetical protein n=1 Tax=Armatimonas sp. TaxID=1872638 RepID=UPI00374DE719
MRKSAVITFQERDFKGSRLRCLLLTHRPRTAVAASLSALVAPHATVTPNDLWAPDGLCNPDEAQLDTTPGFLTPPEQAILTPWWLVHTQRANTPNWDLASTCQIGEKRGLILIEAKAHEGELKADGCGSKNPDNQRQIAAAIADANVGWNALGPGFALSATSHYQLSNRFSFAWKLASMGIPVVLIYLGFLHADEMKPGTILATDAQWDACVRKKASGIVSTGVWGSTYSVGGTPLTVLLRSTHVGIHA